MLERFRQRRAFGQGCALLQEGRWQEAETMFRRATELNPDDSESYHNLGIALLKLERWEEAAAACQCAIALNSGASDPHVTFGIALLKLARWEEAVGAYHRALGSHPDALENLGIALSKLGRWDEAIDAYRQAVALAPDKPGLHRRLGAAHLKSEHWDPAASAFRQALSQDPDDAEASAGLNTARTRLTASESTEESTEADPPIAPPDLGHTMTHLHLGIQLSKLGHFEEATTALQEGISCLQFLLVDPLMRLGRADEAATAYRRAVECGSNRPMLPREPATSAFEKRRASFWSPKNLGAEVFRIERWLKNLATPPLSKEPKPDRTARLMFILDNDYGELTTLLYLVLGRSLINQTTLLLPDRLYANNAEALPGRTHRYASLDDVVQMVDREKPDVVFLCSGYLFTIHGIFSSDELESLAHLLRDRGCRVVTSDPFLGLLSQQDPRTLVSIDIPEQTLCPPSDRTDVAWEKLRKMKEIEDERLWIHLSRCEEIFREADHLYPAYCDTPESLATSTDSRNISFFNAALINLPSAQNDGSVSKIESHKPHWLFILSQTDFDVQVMFETHERFMDIVAGRLVDTLAAGRHPIMVGPKVFIEALARRMPTTEGVDLLYYCPFNQLMSLLLSAEYAFYWNVLSHSILIRLFNQQPAIVFDKGHLVRNVPALYDRIVQWYYQGWEPTFADHREPLTLATVSEYAERYRQEAKTMCERFARAPTPEQMIDNLINTDATHSS